ncbi:MAG TPA: prolyl oligopeptidase family serine peptidase [Atribacterota bacterium]|nr:prolyl oligopeptidase family serine peptidase [Atribacterota bacterium]
MRANAVISRRIKLFYLTAAFLIIVTGCLGFILNGIAQEILTMQDYISEKFPSALFQLYFKTLGELEAPEMEFLDLLAIQPSDRQMFYGKEVYYNGFTIDLLSQLKGEIEDREKSIEKLAEEPLSSEPALITLPPLKFWERILARAVSIQKMVTTTYYNRFAMCGVDPSRSERVVKRVRNYFDWTRQWVKEGQDVEALAEKAEIDGNIFLARRLFHEAAGCYHIGDFINYHSVEEKYRAQEAARRCYGRAIALYESEDRPIRLEIPFRGVDIPGYLMPANKPGQPLIIFVNVLDNIKEVENHFFAQDFLKAGFNIFSFDGPGQGEMHSRMRLIPDYEQAIIAIIDWFEANNNFHLDLERIGVIGLSFGGLFSVLAATQDNRIDCTVNNGGFAYFPPLKHIKKLSLPTRRSVYFMTGYHKIKEFWEEFGHIDIKKSPPLERPMLIIQGGKDEVVPPEHAYYYMDWAAGKDKEFLFFEDSNHCCQDRFDIVLPYIIDWFRKHLLKQ